MKRRASGVWAVIVGVALSVVLSACGASGHMRLRNRPHHYAAQVYQGPVGSFRQDEEAAPIAFHRVDWLAARLPGSICRGTHPIQLRHGWAVARTTRRPDGVWHEWPLIYLSVVGPRNGVVYGRLGGRRAAALRVGCNNGGGTADGFMAYAEIIYVARPHRAPDLVGIVRPHIRPWGQNRLASLLSVVFRGDDVVVHEFFYGGSDGTCCASGRAITVWKFSGGTLKRGQTAITRKPTRA